MRSFFSRKMRKSNRTGADCDATCFEIADVMQKYMSNKSDAIYCVIRMPRLLGRRDFPGVLPSSGGFLGLAILGVVE